MTVTSVAHTPPRIEPAVGVPLRAAGVALAASALLLVSFVPLHPSILGDRPIADVVLHTATWRAIHLAMVVAPLLAAFGVVGIVAALPGAGRLGGAAIVTSATGAVAAAAVGFLEAFAFPLLAEHQPEMLELNGPLLGSVLFRVVAAPAVGYPLSFAVLGLAVRRLPALRLPGNALLLGGVAFVVFEGPFVPVLGVGSTAALAAVQLWWARALWRAGAPA